MRNRLGYAIMVTLLGTSTFLSACSDDEDGFDDTNGGENAGGEPSTGGSSAGKAGSTGGGGRAGAGGSAGSSMGGDTTDAGAGGMSDAGAAGDGGMGGAAAGMGGANVGGAEGGAAGAGGAENPVVTYACTANSIAHKACSALSAGNCDEGIDCGDCVAQVQTDREGFAECATCLALYDKVYQCGIDALESGNLSAGVECLDTGEPGNSPTAADFAEVCWESLNDAVDCEGYASVPANGCPATWPPAE